VKRTLKCPTCGHSVSAEPDRRWQPFCSERCRLIDLGDWMGGRYRIPTDETAPADDSEPPLTKH
jgi:hypothetical protein